MTYVSSALVLGLDALTYVILAVLIVRTGLPASGHVSPVDRAAARGGLALLRSHPELLGLLTLIFEQHPVEAEQRARCVQVVVTWSGRVTSTGPFSRLKNRAREIATSLLPAPGQQHDAREGAERHGGEGPSRRASLAGPTPW